MLFSTILTWLASATVLLQTSTATAIPVSGELVSRDNSTSENIVPFPFDEKNTPYLASTFDVITSIPNSVIQQGDAAVKQWIKDHTSSQPPVSSSTRDLHLRDSDLEARQSWWNIANCVWTILTVIASDEFPLAKILRIKQLISDLGGAWAVAKMVLRAKSLADLIWLGGQELKDLVDLLLGVDSIQGACFHMF